KLRMKWFGDGPKLDIVTGDRKAKSKRGLIGVGWRRMRSATSLHAQFHSQTLDSIGVISGPSARGITVEYEGKQPLAGVELVLTSSTSAQRLTGTSETAHVKPVSATLVDHAGIDITSPDLVILGFPLHIYHSCLYT